MSVISQAPPPLAGVRVAVLDRDAARALSITRALEVGGARVSGHTSTDGFWIGVRRLRPTVLVLEISPPALSAARTVAIAAEFLSSSPGVILYGWAPQKTLAHLEALIADARILSRDEGPHAVVVAVAEMHHAAQQSASRARRARGKDDA